MPRTIGNPLSWTAQTLSGAAGHVTTSMERIGGAPPSSVQINILTMEDLRDSLRRGVADFQAVRADVLMLVAIYPVIGLILAGIGLNEALLPLLFPLFAGFALLGPLAAVGLYEMSRRIEAGEDPSWGAALGLIGRPRFSALVVLGLAHAAIFGIWLLAAWAIWELTLGPETPESLGSFLGSVFTTGAGWAMLILGVGVGTLFALLVLATSVVSFPMLLDKAVGVPRAIVTSIEVARANPRVIGAWGAIVAVSLLLGSIPLLIGLVVVLPVLGHATWHLYRKAVSYG
ncbi:DUF2189 domain-containing protein [Histidinibacterium aquaticum]|uniref:DUF2189 domain-containing protein n=1 Tax=Histidinibacterium aquaticum TaxID=2613962 RepID=A0A5J5GBJ1_9RHOB|nr:DUF2189 domain-containing protein [Histidinibacterium aquaticum]KAA9005273.1 DUF2189 domain-containing protein [Histidinibacterium aquaticum]